MSASTAATKAAAAAAAAARLFGIAGKVAVVTGGGRGIGEMIARTYVEAGAKVYITSRSSDACTATAATLSAAGPGSCIALPHDLSTEDGCRAFALEFAAHEAACHILVNNSGAAWGAPFDAFPEKQFDRIMALNVKTVFLMTRVMRPFLSKASVATDPARIINIGSITGNIAQPVPTYSYDISKAAVHHLTRKLSAELAPEITVNAIAPGFVPTKMSRGLLATMDESAVRSAIPMARFGNTDDIGGAAVYLASRAGAWVNGQVLGVDGGQSAMPLMMSTGL